MCLGCVCLYAFEDNVCKASNGTSQPTTNLTALELTHHALALCPCFHTLLIHFWLGLTTCELCGEVVGVLR